jgi:hypothetical protein
MGKMMTTALAGAFLGLTAGSVSAAFSSYNLNGIYVIEAHGFQINTTNTGENDILGLVTLDGAGGVVPGGGFSFSHADSSGFNFQVICSLSITGGSYSVNSVAGTGNITINLGLGPFPGGAPACNGLESNSSLTFAFVLNNSGVFASPFATSASLQLIAYNPVPLLVQGSDHEVIIDKMVMTGSLRLQGSASE